MVLRCQGNALRDPSGRMTHRDLPPMACTLNYLMTDVNWENGPLRTIDLLGPRPPSDPTTVSWLIDLLGPLFPSPPA